MLIRTPYFDNLYYDLQVFFNFAGFKIILFYMYNIWWKGLKK